MLKFYLLTAEKTENCVSTTNLNIAHIYALPTFLLDINAISSILSAFPYFIITKYAVVYDGMVTVLSVVVGTATPRR